MDTFSVVAEPNRRLLLDALLTGPQSVNALVDQMEMSQPVVSKHLKILKEAGFVSVTPRGQQRLYCINPEPLRELSQWLAPYLHFWNNKLNELEAHLDNDKQVPE